MIENIYSVRIIRTMEQTLVAWFIKAFWMFCGVYIEEYIIGQDSMNDQWVDLNIILTNDRGLDFQMPLACEQILLSEENTKDLCFSSAKKRSESGEGILEKIFSLENTANWSDELKKCFLILRKTFVDKDYAYLDYISHLFIKQLDKNTRDKIFKMYISCFNDLFDKASQIEGSNDLHLKYAYLNCARKINRLCDIRLVVRIFDDQKLMREAHKLSEADEIFSIGNVLAGMIGLNTLKYWTHGEFYIKNAIQKEQNKKYSAFIFYCLGHFYEMVRRNKECAWEQYQQMLNISPYNYRALFKYACYKYHLADKEEACKYFYNIYTMMNIKKENKWIQPLELEYYYKCAKLLSDHSFKDIVKKYDANITKNDLYNIMDTEFKQSKFDKELFGREKSSIQKFFLKKMEEHNFQQIVRE